MAPIDQINTTLVNRLRPLLEEAGMGTGTGGYDDMTGPIGQALRELGGTQADLTAIDQADLDTLDASKVDQLLDLSELHTLELVYVTLDPGGVHALDLQVSSSFSGIVASRIAWLTAKLAKTAGYGRAKATRGTITLKVSQPRRPRLLGRLPWL